MGSRSDIAAALFGQSVDTVVAEVRGVLGRADRIVAAELIAELQTARAVYVAGAGRSGLTVESFAMRLMHLGWTAHVAGDVTTPSIGASDLLVVCSGSGQRPTVLALAQAAKESGARLAVVTAATDSPLAGLADLVILLPEGRDGYNSPDTEQFMGTLFEQGSYLFFDSVVLTIQKLADIDAAEMRERHTNLE